jgi:hypothetical protein
VSTVVAVLSVAVAWLVPVPQAANTNTEAKAIMIFFMVFVCLINDKNSNIRNPFDIKKYFSYFFRIFFFIIYK